MAVDLLNRSTWIKYDGVDVRFMRGGVLSPPFCKGGLGGFFKNDHNNVRMPLPVQIFADDSMVDLQEPGAGLPELERVFLNAMFRCGTAVLSANKALQIFNSAANTILEIVADTDINRASQQVLVPRFIGMEDSSRNWSLLMVVEHLRMVDREILSAIRMLLQGHAPLGDVSIADYKPDPDVGWDVIDQFERLIDEYQDFMSTRPSLRTQLRYRHPWFGPLDGHGWLCLAAMHHRIHRKQAKKIIALMGVI